MCGWAIQSGVKRTKWNGLRKIEKKTLRDEIGKRTFCLLNPVCPWILFIQSTGEKKSLSRKKILSREILFKIFNWNSPILPPHQFLCSLFSCQKMQFEEQKSLQKLAGNFRGGSNEENMMKLEEFCGKCALN